MAILFVTSALSWSSLAVAGPPVLPQGGRVVAGSATISGAGGRLTIDQSSAKAIIDWNSFSIGPGERVVFDNGHGATLDRVTSFSPAIINGLLQSTGAVYLIDPAGVVIASDGRVVTGGDFIASTLDVNDASFLSSAAVTLSGAGSGSVANAGEITNGSD